MFVDLLDVLHGLLHTLAEVSLLLRRSNPGAEGVLVVEVLVLGVLSVLPQQLLDLLVIVLVVLGS